MEQGKLLDFASYVTEKVSNQLLTNENYVGVDNLISNRGGKTKSEYVPSDGWIFYKI